MPEPGIVDRAIARLLGTPWLVRLPIALYRAGFGWVFGRRLVMIEHLGRSSHEPRYVVVEVVERERDVIRVASGFGGTAQWYRNLKANGVAYLSTGRARRVPAAVRMLDATESAELLKGYAAAHPEAWRRLSAAMDFAAGGVAEIPIVEFRPPDPPSAQAVPRPESG
ncbi:MAG: nitroreductase family deazaflavin-dependent oxidoreductase [Microbacterium sp.]